MTPKKLKKVLAVIFFISIPFPIFCYEAVMAICAVALIACFLGMFYSMYMLTSSSTDFI